MVKFHRVVNFLRNSSAQCRMFIIVYNKKIIDTDIITGLPAALTGVHCAVYRRFEQNRRDHSSATRPLPTPHPSVLAFLLARWVYSTNIITPNLKIVVSAVTRSRSGIYLRGWTFFFWFSIWFFKVNSHLLFESLQSLRSLNSLIFSILSYYISKKI